MREVIMSIQIPRTPFVLTKFGVTCFPVEIRKRGGFETRCSACDQEVTDGNVVAVIRPGSPRLLLHPACTPAEVLKKAKE